MSQPQLTLFDDIGWEHLLPLTFTKPAACLRNGLFTNAERWQQVLSNTAAFLTRPHLQQAFPPGEAGPTLYINGRYYPDSTLVEAICQLQPGQCLRDGNMLLAAHSEQKFETPESLQQAVFNNAELGGKRLFYDRTWQLFHQCAEIIRLDLQRHLEGKTSAPVSTTNTVIGHNLFIEPGAVVEAATINTQSGPVYIGEGAEVMEGALIRGPFVLGAHSTVKMGAKIYGPTSIGPHCKVGGEINNSVVMGFSNKAHDGFLGNAVIGEWCNLGADSNNSNLKNNYAEVKLYHYPTRRFEPTGLQFCGLIMADHAKCGINTMFNTGTVVGVHANIFGDGFPRNFIPSFSWGGAAGFTPYKISDALQVAEKVMGRRGIQITEEEKQILTFVFHTEQNTQK